MKIKEREREREREMKKKTSHELKSYGSMSQGSRHDEIVLMDCEEESSSKKDKKECCEEERHSGDVSYVVFEIFFFLKIHFLF